MLQHRLAEHEAYLNGFNKVFKAIDTDRDGWLDRKEFGDLMNRLKIGLDSREIQSLYDKLPSNE